MISQNIKDFIERYRILLSSQKEDESSPKIHVDEIASKVARVYERIRTLIDYQEEHLLRKRYVNRILVRRFLLKNINPNIAEPLIKEVVRSGHLSNDSVPETKIKEIQKNERRAFGFRQRTRGNVKKAKETKRRIGHRQRA